MESTSQFLTLLGGLFLLSMLVSSLAHKLKVPRVTLLIMSGFAIGPIGLNLINGLEKDWFEIIANITLLIIGYLLGTKLTLKYIQQYGYSVSVTTFALTIATFFVVLFGLMFIGLSWQLSAVLACLAVATDPTATIDVIDQDNPKRNQPLKQLIRGVVALDDVVALLIFTVVTTIIITVNETNNAGFLDGVVHFGYETLGALALGSVLGAVMTFVFNKKRSGHPVIVESFGLILLCGGIASYLNMSYLLAAMAMGIVVINYANSAQEHLHEIELIEQPFLVLFFVLAGASLKLESATEVASIIVAYIVLRTIGRAITGYLLPKRFRCGGHPAKLGLAFTSQAGVAMGMALVAATILPAEKDTIITVAITATVFFELFGPLLTAYTITSKH